MSSLSRHELLKVLWGVSIAKKRFTALRKQSRECVTSLFFTQISSTGAFDSHRRLFMRERERERENT